MTYLKEFVTIKFLNSIQNSVLQDQETVVVFVVE